MIAVSAAEHKLAKRAVVKIEAEDWLRQLARDHQLVHHSWNMEDRNGIPTQTKGAIKFTSTVTKTNPNCVIDLGKSENGPTLTSSAESTPDARPDAYWNLKTVQFFWYVEDLSWL